MFHFIKTKYERLGLSTKLRYYYISHLINEVTNQVNELLRKGIENDNIITPLMLFPFYSVADCR